MSVTEDLMNRCFDEIKRPLLAQIAELEQQVSDAEWLAGTHSSRAPVNHHGDWYVVTALTVITHCSDYWDALHLSRDWWENGVEYDKEAAESPPAE